MNSNLSDFKWFMAQLQGRSGALGSGCGVKGGASRMLGPDGRAVSYTRERQLENCLTLGFYVL